MPPGLGVLRPGLHAPCLDQPHVALLASRSLTRCSVSVGQQHSHLGDVMTELEQRGQGATKSASKHTRSSSHHQQQQHVFRQQSPNICSYQRPIQQASVPHLDGCCDASEALSMLREQVLENRSSAIITADESGDALFDLISVLILLDEDVRSVDSGSVLLFQPVLDIRNKVPARILNSSDHLTALNNANELLAALVTTAHCPKMVSRQPSSCVVATPSLDTASQVAATIVKVLEEHGNTKLRVVTNSAGLIAGWKAMRAARAVVRSQSSGARDLLFTPYLCWDTTPAQPPAETEYLSVSSVQNGTTVVAHVNGHTLSHVGGAGNGYDHTNGHTSAAASPPRQQQQGMYFNIWLR